MLKANATIFLTAFLLFLPPSVLSQQESAATSGKTLSLNQCFEQAMAKHPLLAAARSRIGGAEQLKQFAGVRPNPSITLQSENWRFTGRPSFQAGQDLDVFIYGTQTIERGDKATRRREVAEQVANLAETELEALQRRIKQEILRSYYRAVIAQMTIEILNENRQNLEQLVKYNDVRVREGYTAEGELIRVRLEFQTAATHEATAAQELERAKLDLLKAMGATLFQTDFRLTDYSDMSATESLAKTAAVAPLEEFLKEALMKRPELLLLRARLEHAKATLRLAQANAKSDWSASFGYKRTSGFNTFIAGVSIPLHIYNKNEGEIGRATAEIAAIEHELLAEENFIRAEVQAAFQASESLRQRLKALQNDFLLQADDARNVALVAYREGAADLYKVLEAQRARNEARLLYHRTLYDFRLSLSELALMVGQEGLTTK
jgi:cobalt-zinc-cadmium efflux system outer membrane protein